MSNAFTVKPHKDDPVDNATLLGAGKMVSTLTNFLSADNLISPLVIAVNGAWGSGKTSIIDTVKKELDKNKIVTAKFNAWQYEYSEPASALVYHVIKQTQPANSQLKQKAKDMAMLALEIFARKTADIDIAEIRRTFQGSINAVTTLSGQLQDFIEKEIKIPRVVVFIDDLDRCSLENVIVMLEAIKLFLTVPKMVFVLAVDISKVKLAWSHKYGSADEKLTEEGLKYLEKIIQIQIELPKPTPEEIKEYLKSLDQEYSNEFTALVSVLGLRNPRSIKRLLNVISFKSNIPDTGSGKTEAAVIWCTLEIASGEEGAARLYRALGNGKKLCQMLSRVGGLAEQEWEHELSNKGDYSKFKDNLGQISLRDMRSYCVAVRPFAGAGGEIYDALDQIAAFSRRI